MKQDNKHRGYNPVIATSNGIGKGYIERVDSKRNMFRGEETEETYKNRAGYKMGLPIYYRNKLYTEEQREKLWISKLDKQERYIMGEKIDVSRDEKEYWQALKYAQIKNEELGYGGNSNEWAKLKYENEIRILKQMERLSGSNAPGVS